MKTTLIRRSSVSLFAMMVMAFCFVASSASASWVVDADRTSFYGAGTTFTMEGNLASFAGNYTEAGGTVTNGTDKTVTTSTDSGDWYFSLNPGVAVSTYRYAEVFYSLGDDWSGSTHQLRLDTSVEGADWDDPGNESDFPAGTGDHSIVIDLLSDDGITPTAPARWSGNWTYFRWDFFNNVGNSNKTFTLDKVVFASEALAVSLGPVASLGGADAYSGGATLRGELLDDEPANAYICWGESDGGTVSTGHWDHVVSFVSVSTGVVFSAEVSNLYYGIEYDYRVYVTNATDSHWSALGTPFATPHVQRVFLFGDDSDDGVSTNLTDPALRASGTLSNTVKYAVSNVTAADEVAVTNGLL
ncbi:MAG: hypothetical protein HN341_01015, partial [Verrucomicrobia bacterium]|nr:hypothetical protein [Verrucomicrobiota bacterium]